MFRDDLRHRAAALICQSKRLFFFIIITTSLQNGNIGQSVYSSRDNVCYEDYSLRLGPSV